MSTNPIPHWLDSTGRFQRELDAVSNEIAEQKAKVDVLNDQLKQFQQEHAAAGKKGGWFSSERPAFEVEYDLEMVQLKLKSERPILNDLEAGYQELTSNLFPPGKVWTFE